MTPEKEKQLRDKYPSILRDMDKPATESCMAFGLCVGDGWYKLLDKLMAAIMAQPGGDTLVADQVKEKFGGLRFYCHGSRTDAIDNLLNQAEEDSYRTCEVCGAQSAANLTKYTRTGWMVTLCTKHFEECEARYDEI